MDVNKLKGKIIEKGMNVERLADKIGVDRSTLYRKLDSAEKFTVGEVNKIKNVLELSMQDASDIFFG